MKRPISDLETSHERLAMESERADICREIGGFYDVRTLDMEAICCSMHVCASCTEF